MLFGKKDKGAGVRLPWNFWSFIATWFFVGMIPIAPGTFGSLFSYPLYYVSYHIPITALLLLLILLYYAARHSISNLEKQIKYHDHSSIVIDEVIGMLVAFVIIFSVNIETLLSLSALVLPDYDPCSVVFLLIFLLFRFFDITKLGPVGYVEKKYKNADGVILDDVVAGILTGMVIIMLPTIVNYFDF